MAEEDSKKPVDTSKILTQEDIEKLIKSPFEKKVDITQKIAKYYSKGGFDADQMDVAQEIFRTLVKDTEVEIRQALSDAIKHIDTVPHDVVMDLANDVEDVSIPILEFSDVLTDEDLVEIVTTTEDVNKQKSISRRDAVSESVTEALVETHNEEVVDELLQNEGAEISEDSFTQIVDDFADKDEIMESVVQREVLPVEVVERLAEKVSDVVYKNLAVTHADTFEKVSGVLKQSREVATMKMIGMKSNKDEYYQFRKLMDKLHISDDLAPVYALCMGNLGIFEVCIARLTQTPVLNVRTLLYDETNKGFKAIYDRAKLPEELFEIMEVLVEVLRDMFEELDGHGIYLSDDMGNKIIEKMTALAEKKGKTDKLDYVSSLIRHNTMVLGNG